jgi:hypothetical protein
MLIKEKEKAQNMKNSKKQKDTEEKKKKKKKKTEIGKTTLTDKEKRKSEFDGIRILLLSHEDTVQDHI